MEVPISECWSRSYLQDLSLSNGQTHGVEKPRKKARIVTCEILRRFIQTKWHHPRLRHVPSSRLTLSIASHVGWPLRGNESFHEATLDPGPGGVGLVSLGVIWKFQRALCGLRTSPVSWETQWDYTLKQLNWPQGSKMTRLVICEGSPCVLGCRGKTYQENKRNSPVLLSRWPRGFLIPRRIWSLMWILTAAPQHIINSIVKSLFANKYIYIYAAGCLIEPPLFTLCARNLRKRSAKMIFFIKISFPKSVRRGGSIKHP